MKVSIVIPCFNEAETIEILVHAVLSAPINNREVIIVDDGSSDNTVEILQKYLNDSIHLYQAGKIGKVAAFNLAFSKSMPFGAKSANGFGLLDGASVFGVSGSGPQGNSSDSSEDWTPILNFSASRTNSD